MRAWCSRPRSAGRPSPFPFLMLSRPVDSGFGPGRFATIMCLVTWLVAGLGAVREANKYEPEPICAKLVALMVVPDALIMASPAVAIKLATIQYSVVVAALSLAQKCVLEERILRITASMSARFNSTFDPNYAAI